MAGVNPSDRFTPDIDYSPARKVLRTPPQKRAFLQLGEHWLRLCRICYPLLCSHLFPADPFTCGLSLGVLLSEKHYLFPLIPLRFSSCRLRDSTCCDS